MAIQFISHKGSDVFYVTLTVEHGTYTNDKMYISHFQVEMVIQTIAITLLIETHWKMTLSSFICIIQKSLNFVQAKNPLAVLEIPKKL